jgi:hypothetical protein
MLVDRPGIALESGGEVIRLVLRRGVFRGVDPKRKSLLAHIPENKHCEGHEKGYERER